MPTGSFSPGQLPAALSRGPLAIRGDVHMIAGTNIAKLAAGAGGAQGWDDTLGVDPHSGAHDAFVDTGRFLSFGTAAPGQTTGHIRAEGNLFIHPDTGFEVQAHDTIHIHGPDTVLIESTGGSPVQLDSSAAIQLTSTASEITLSAGTFVNISGGFVRFTEAAASTPVMAAGQALFWVRNDTPNRPMFTDDTNVDARIALLPLPLSDLASQAADTFVGRLAGAGVPTAQLFTDIDSTSIVYDVATHTFQLAAASGGDITRSQNSVTYTIGTNVVTNAKAAQMAANTIKANPTAALANAQDLAIAADSFPARVGGNLVSHPFATLFGTYLSYSAGVADWIGLDVRVNTGVNTGTRRRLNVIGSSPISVGAVDDAANDEVDVTISVANIPLSSLATIASLSVLGNPTGSGAVPSAIVSSVDDTVVRRTGSTINFGQLTVGMAPNDVWTYAKIQNVSAQNRFLGRISVGAGDIEELTGTQATTLLDTFTSALKGLAPASGGGATNFLRADGTWAAPSSGTAGHVIKDDDVSMTQRAGLNFRSSTTINAILTDDAGANETEVAHTVNQTADFAWTGEHSFTAVNFTTALTGNLILATTDGAGIFAGYAGAGLSAGDIMLNATSGIGIFAGHAAAEVAMSENDISVGALLGLALTAGVAPVTNVANGLLLETGASNFRIVTNGVERLEITSAGEWQVDSSSGDPGQVLTSNGPGVPPSWQFPGMTSALLSVRDDFTGGHQGFNQGLYGETGWCRVRTGDSNGEAVGIQGEDNHPGIVRMETGNPVATAQTVALVRGTNSNNANQESIAQMSANDVDYMEFVVRCTGTITLAVYRAGLMDDGLLSTAGAHGIFFRLQPSTDTSWHVVARNSSVETDTDTGVVAVAGTWYKLQAIRTGATAFDFYINDVLVASISNANVPTTDLCQMVMSVQSTTATNRQFDIDFAAFAGNSVVRF